MPKALKHIDAEELEADPRRVLDLVVREREAVVIVTRDGKLAVLKPMRRRASNRRASRSEADDATFLATAGAWAEAVDTEALKDAIADSRRISSRPRPDL